MIQAPLPKPIELPKAQPKRADAEVVSNQKQPQRASRKEEVSSKKDDVSSKKKDEFDKELEKATSEGTESEVKSVQVSEDLEMPSKLSNPNGTVETTSPKIFDPALTKDVDKLIQPKTTDGKPVVLTDEQIAQLANGEVDPKALNAELEQAMLKTPQTNSGRAPAIDFAKAEVDPQLLNNDDFVAQKNMAAKKAAPNAYGMKVVPQTQQQKIAMENGLQQSQVVNEASAKESAMNSQQFILGLQSDAKAPQLNIETHSAPVKTFDMSNIKSSQPTEIMNQITDYVVQAKAAKEPTVNMRVNHDELGMIDITVSRVGHANADTIAINIGAHSTDGKNFFQQNSKDLFSHLTNAGMNVTDLKVETPTQTAKNDFDFGSQSGRNGQGSEKQFGSEQNQRRHDQDRRQDLWKLLSKEAA